jgi:hypothetical protein
MTMTEEAAYFCFSDFSGMARRLTSSLHGVKWTSYFECGKCDHVVMVTVALTR